MSGLGLCSLLVGLGAIAPQGDTLPWRPIDRALLEVNPVTGPASDTAERLARALEEYTLSGGYDELEACLIAAARHFPQRLVLRSLGRSGGGRELYVVEIGESGEHSRSERPALVVVPDLEWDARDAARATMSVFAELLAEAERDGPLLERVTWYVMPAPLPDRLESADPPGSVDPTHNFPVNWDPWCSEPPGPYPLSLPETRALADLLTRLPRVAGAVLVGERAVDVGRYAVAGVDPQDLDVQGWLSAEVPRGAASSPRSGGFREFCFAHAGLHVLDLPQSVSADPTALAGHLRDCARALPALSLSPPRFESLGGGLWQVELDLTNLGLLPTGSEAARRRGVAGRVTLSWEGARVRALCVRDPRTGSFEVVAPGNRAPLLAALGSQEARRLRLVVEGQPGARLVLTARSPRAGGARLEVPLP